MTRSNIFLFFVLTVLAPALGCQTVTPPSWEKLTDKLSWNKNKESQYEQPARMASIWTYDVLTTPGKAPVQGLGGRLYFYNARSQTVPVDGQLTVYAFDDSSGADPNAEPQRFCFTGDQFTKHFKETDLGASYSVWIPLQQLGSPTRKVSVLPVFTCSNGFRVVGQQSVHVLAGSDNPALTSARPISQMRSTGFQNVRPVGYSAQVPAGTQQPKKSGVNRKEPARTTTIAVSRNLGRHLSAKPVPSYGPELSVSGKQLALPQEYAPRQASIGPAYGNQMPAGSAATATANTPSSPYVPIQTRTGTTGLNIPGRSNASLQQMQRQAQATAYAQQVALNQMDSTGAFRAPTAAAVSLGIPAGLGGAVETPAANQASQDQQSLPQQPATTTGASSGSSGSDTGQTNTQSSARPAPSTARQRANVQFPKKSSYFPKSLARSVSRRSPAQARLVDGQGPGAGRSSQYLSKRPFFPQPQP